MRRPRERSGQRAGGAEDRVSELPTGLLLQILAGVRSARTVARAALLSRQWRGLWELLPEIHLDGVTPGSFGAALARLKAERDAAALAPPDLIHVAAYYCPGGVSPRLVSSWLRRAAGLAPGELSLAVTASGSSSFKSVVRLPCLDDRTNSVVLRLRYLRLAPPLAGGDLLALERLVVKECRLDAAALLPRCPRLRVLEVGPEAELDSPAAIDLPLLEELAVVESLHRAQLHIVAPLLRHLSLSTHIRDASVSAPNLEKLSMDCSRDYEKIELGDMAQMHEVKLFGLGLLGGSKDRLRIGNGVGRVLQQLPHLHFLGISIAMRSVHTTTINDYWLQKLPITNILMLQLSTCGHEFGATVLLLLKMVECVQELTMLLDSPEETHFPGCQCHNSQACTSLSLPLLKKVEFKGFTGAKSAVNVLEQLLTSAKALEQMTVTLCKKDPSNHEVHKKQLLNIFNLYPTVNCKVLDV